MMMKIYKMAFRIWWLGMGVAALGLIFYGVFSDVDGLHLKLYLAWYLKILLASIFFTATAFLLILVRSTDSS